MTSDGSIYLLLHFLSWLRVNMQKFIPLIECLFDVRLVSLHNFACLNVEHSQLI